MRQRRQSVESTVEPEVSVYQVAEHLDVNEETVRRWMREGMPARKYNSRLLGTAAIDIMPVVSLG